jgi:CheY-like chemotaxis protein
LFLANQANQSFTFFNDHFANFFSENNTLEESIAFEKLYAIAHEDDRHLLHKLLASSIDQSLVNEDGENIRFFCKKGICRVFNLRCTKLADAADDYSITGILTDVTDLLWFEQQQKKSDKTFRELSFITSHELRHEYAKIQSIIQMLDNVLISENERNEMIAASRQSIQVINSTIFKINHKLSFNQTDGYFDFYKKNHQYKKIILIDDDGLTNTINKRIIQLVNNTIEVVVFTDIEAAETFLITADQSGEYLILLDVNFPFSSGWEFLENYQQFHIQSKVIVLSSSIDTYDRDKARKYPMVVDYITKPLSLEMVKEMLYA